MLHWFTADLHVHTCLSPCAEVTMSPRRIVAEAGRKELDLLAVTDHNSAENAAAVQRAARGSRVTVIPGLEVCSSEEVHVLALFPDIDAALVMQETVYDGIREQNRPEVFGMQVIANEKDEVEGFQDRLLIGASALTVDEVVRRIHALGGVAIASHVDRQAFGILGQLGFIPPGLQLDALEVSRTAPPQQIATLVREHPGACFLRSSDAHRPVEIGTGVTRFLLEEPVLAEIRKALRNEEQRRTATDLTEAH